MEALTEDCLTLLVAQLLVPECQDDSENHQRTWVRRTLPLICKQWNTLLQSPNPAYEHVVIDPACEKQFARKLARNSREACSSPSSCGGSPTARRQAQPTIDPEAVISWLRPRCSGVKSLSINSPAYNLSRRHLNQIFSLLRRTLLRLHWTGTGIVEHEYYDAIGQLKHLEQLRMRRVSEGFLDALGNLAFLPKLVELDFSLDLLPTYPTRIRELPSRLTQLAMANVWLSELPRALLGLQQLAKLSLMDCRIDTDPLPLCCTLPALQELEVQGLATQEASPRFKPSSSITSMKLSASGLQQVCPSIAQLSKLRSLDLSHNAAMGTNAQASLPSGLAQLEALQALNLDGCGLASVPHAVLALPNLQQLSLKGNSLCSVPASSAAFTRQLAFLDMRANRLAALPPLVLACTQLTELRCSSNALAGCPQAGQLAKQLPLLRRLVVGGTTHDSRAVRQLLALSHNAAALGRELQMELSD